MPKSPRPGTDDPPRHVGRMQRTAQADGVQKVVVAERAGHDPSRRVRAWLKPQIDCQRPGACVDHPVVDEPVVKGPHSGQKGKLAAEVEWRINEVKEPFAPSW